MWFWVANMEEIRTRKNARLDGYDYAQAGRYFITICVKDQHEMLGEIVVGAGLSRPKIELSQYGEIVEKWIDKISDKYSYITIPHYVIMPNHIHMILAIQSGKTLRRYGCAQSNLDCGRDGIRCGRDDPAPTSRLGSIMGYFKYQTTKECGFSLFQRSYHDHIIRNEKDYRRIVQHIKENPMKWQEDCYYTVHPKPMKTEGNL